MEKIIVAIGGGEIKTKQTSQIDGQIAELAKRRAEGRRPIALFVGTASRDSMPYYNSFHKTYTGLYGLKTDCALTVYGEMDDEKIRKKFQAADLIYVGGGNTIYMLESWKKSGAAEYMRQAYDRGAIICGLSAGAICWFEEMFTDGYGEDYRFEKGLGWLEGGACPHFNWRKEDFIAKADRATQRNWTCVEDLSAVMFVDGKLAFSLLGEGSSYSAKIDGERVEFNEIEKKKA